MAHEGDKIARKTASSFLVSCCKGLNRAPATEINDQKQLRETFGYKEEQWDLWLDAALKKWAHRWKDSAIAPPVGVWCGDLSDGRPVVWEKRGVRTESRGHHTARHVGWEEPANETENKRSEVRRVWGTDTGSPGKGGGFSGRGHCSSLGIISINSISTMICVRHSNSISTNFCKIPILIQKPTLLY